MEERTDPYCELLDSAKRVDHFCDDFERAWLAGDRPEIEAYLARVAASERPNLLAELLQVELDAQLTRGVRPDRDEYVRRFPECAALIDQVLNKDATVERGGTSMLTSDVGPPSDAIEGFRLIKELSRGGQAVVYQAIQLSTKRKVALKVMLEGPFAGTETKQRFGREIELVGGLRHPGIVSIYESGVSIGRCYYAMEYIQGETLTDYVQFRRLELQDTLRLFFQVCDAVDYAHQRGVIHRDLKPSNILVDERDDPRVLDFGLAKIASAEVGTLVSRTGQILGTPAYMSPEQATGRPHEVDMRSDVYALGVILYELTTDQLPYDVTGSWAEMLHAIQHVQPKRPSLTGTHVNSEVEMIILKALDKDKRRRYDTAGALGRDIKRFLDREPIEAKRDSMAYILRKALNRYRVPAAIVATFLLLIVVATVALSVLYYRAEVSNRRAQAASEEQAGVAERLRHELYISDISSAAETWENSNLSRMSRLLDRHRPVGGQEDHHGFEWDLLSETYQSAVRQPSLPHNDQVLSVVFSPDGKTLATVSGDTIWLWDTATREVTTSLPGRSRRLWAVAISPDGKTLASGSEDGIVVLWDMATRRQRCTLPQDTTLLQGLAFSPDSQMVAITGYGGAGLKLRNVEMGDEIQAHFKSGFGHAVAFSPDSKMMALGGGGVVRLWNLASTDEQEPPISFHYDKTNVRCVAFSPDGKLLAMGGDESLVRLHDLVRDELKVVFEGHLAPITCGAFSPDGRTFATGSADRTVRLWDVETGLETAVLRGHASRITSLAFSPDGTVLASGSDDRKVLLWDARRPDPGRLELHQSAVWNLAFSPNAKQLVSVGWNHPSLVLWNVATGHGESLTEGDLAFQAAAFSPNGRMLAVGGYAPDLTIWDPHTRTEILRKREGGITSLAFSPDGTQLASTNRIERIVKIWNTETWNLITSLDGPRWTMANVAFSPDGRLFASPTGRTTATVYDTRSWEKVAELKEHEWPLHDVAFSPDGGMVATSSQDGTVKLWDLTTFQVADTLTGETSGVLCAAFSPDGTTLVSGGIDNRINLWNLKLHQPTPLVATLRGHTSGILRAAFSSDGKILATASKDGTVRLWRGAP